MESVVAPANMRRAWAQVKSNQGAPGCDGMPIEDFPAYARACWPVIRQALLDGTYCPQPIRRVTIPKPGGGERALGIPSVVDRVIQQAIAQVMTPIFDPGFSESRLRIPSMGFVLRTGLQPSKIVPDDFVGFRPKRSAHGALRQVQAAISAGYRVAVNLDLAKFFDNVGHDVLMSRVARRIGDQRLLALIGRYLRARVRVGESIQATELGTPQGGALSPLLTNILLDDLDKELERRGHLPAGTPAQAGRFVRYADDLLILVKSHRAGERVMASVMRFLTRKLKLVVNEHKSRVAKINDCKLLGFTFRGTKLRWSERTYQDFRHQIRKLTSRSWGVSMAYRFHKLAQYVRGWMGYFGISDYYRPISDNFAGSEIGRTQCARRGRAMDGAQQLLAPVQNSGDPDRDDPSMAEDPRADLDP